MANNSTSTKYKIINLTLPLLLDTCVVSIFFSEIYLKLYFFFFREIKINGSILFSMTTPVKTNKWTNTQILKKKSDMGWEFFGSC